MFKEIKQHWSQFRKYPAGKRFELYYGSRHNVERGPLKKIFLIATGIVIMMAGIIFLAIPGPGLLVMLLGAALIARESLFVSRLFDRLEPYLWKFARWCRNTWQELSSAAKTSLVVIAAMFGVVAMFLAIFIVF
jgi:hypothetical protein